jgi:hypothetical protein
MRSAATTIDLPELQIAAIQTVMGLLILALCSGPSAYGTGKTWASGKTCAPNRCSWFVTPGLTSALAATGQGVARKRSRQLFPTVHRGWFQRGDARINREGRPRGTGTASDRAPQADRLCACCWMRGTFSIA